MKKRSILLSAVLAIAVCVSLIAGATYALFTSNSSVNIAITSGKVDVSATISGLTTTSMGETQESGKWANGGEATFAGNNVTLAGITPGDAVSFDIKITNNSNVTVKYKVTYAVKGDLADVLAVTVSGAACDEWEEWRTEVVAEKTVTVSVEFPADAEDEYQDKRASVVFAVEAVQGNAETYNYVKVTKQWGLGEKINRPLRDYGFENIFAREEDDKFYILNEAGFVELMQALSKDMEELNNRDDRGDVIERYDGSWFNDKYSGTEFVVMADLDFKGVSWADIAPAFATALWSNSAQNMVIDFNHHALKNVTVNAPATKEVGIFGSASRLTVKNLTVDGATVTGGENVGILYGTTHGGSCVTENVTVRKSTVTGNKYVGGISGYVPGTIRNCVVEGCTLQIADGGQYTVGCLSAYQNDEGREYKYVTGNVVRNNIVIGCRAGLLFGQTQTEVPIENVFGNTVSGNTINGAASSRLVGVFYDVDYHGQYGEDVSEQMTTYFPNQK